MPADIGTINSITNVTDTFNSATLTVATVIIPQDPGSASAGMLTKMLQYLRFLNIPYSQRLELTFKPHNSIAGPFGIGPKLPAEALTKIPMHPIPQRFMKFHVHSSFLVNFWDSLIFMSIIIFCVALFKLAEWSISKIKNRPVPYPIVKKIRAAVQNMFFMQFYNILGDVLFFSIFELKNLNFESAETIISFCLAILFICIGGLVIAIHLSILLKFYNLRKKTAWVSKIEGLYKAYEGSEVFFKHFKNKTVLTQSFLLLFVVRNVLFYLTIALLSGYPLVQAMLIFILTIFILGYLILLRPFNTIVNLLQQITCEVMFLLANTCVFIIIQLDFKKENSNHIRDSLCDVIIYTSLVFTLVPQAFLAVKIVIGIIEWYKVYRNKSNQPNTKQIPTITINHRLQDNISQYVEHDNQSLNDSSAALSVVQNSTFSVQTQNSLPVNSNFHDNSQSQTDQVRRNVLKRRARGMILFT